MDYMDYSYMPEAAMRVLMRLEPLDFDVLKAEMEQEESMVVVEAMLVDALHDMRTRGTITHGSEFTNIRRALG